MSLDLTRLSKTISHALRHEPWVYELELDESGWVSVDQLLMALREEKPVAWASVSEADITAIIAAHWPLKRFEMVDGRIRAYYGHSVPAKIEMQPAEPPAILYHGTAPEVAEIIRREGLRPMNRQYVHLSADVETAKMVGSRKAKVPEIVLVNAGEAFRNGVAFYHGNNVVWLADAVPAAFIR